MNVIDWYRRPRTEPLLQYLLFACLIIATPFVVVTRYLQGMVHVISHFSFTLFDHEIPFLLTAAVLLLVTFLIVKFRSLTIRNVVPGLFIIVMLTIAYQVQDNFLQLSFFDLQQNWHYISYCLYVFFFFRLFNLRKMKIHRMVLFSFLSVILLSLIDETFQYFLSHRVFDISDITKDAWGSLIGLILVLFVSKSYGELPLNRNSFWSSNPKHYFNQPISTLIVLFLITFAFLLVSPLLSSHEEWKTLFLFASLLSLTFLFLYHLMQFKTIRLAIVIVFFIIVAGLTLIHVKLKDRNIVHNQYGLLIVQGVPLPFFDAIIYPDGTFRFIDKKHHYTSQDISYLFRQDLDILIVGSGYSGQGGKGFDIGRPTGFVFNSQTGSIVQVIVLPTSEACDIYNRLRSEGKRVLFLVHTTC